MVVSECKFAMALPPGIESTGNRPTWLRQHIGRVENRLALRTLRSPRTQLSRIFRSALLIVVPCLASGALDNQLSLESSPKPAAYPYQNQFLQLCQTDCPLISGKDGITGTGRHYLAHLNHLILIEIHPNVKTFLRLWASYMHDSPISRDGDDSPYRRQHSTTIERLFARQTPHNGVMPPE